MERIQLFMSEIGHFRRLYVHSHLFWIFIFEKSHNLDKSDLSRYFFPLSTSANDSNEKLRHGSEKDRKGINLQNLALNNEVFDGVSKRVRYELPQITALILSSRGF